MGILGDGGHWGTWVASQGFVVLGGVVGMWLCSWKAREAGGLKGPEDPLGNLGYLKGREQIVLRAPALPEPPKQGVQKWQDALPSMVPCAGSQTQLQELSFATWGQRSHAMQGRLPWVSGP